MSHVNKMTAKQTFCAAGVLVLLAPFSGCNSSGFSDLENTSSGPGASTGVFAFSDSGTILPNAYEGQIYTVDFATQNGIAPVSYTVDSGTVPTGLALSQTGILTGKITAAPGTFNFTIRATDNSSNTITQNLTLTLSVPFSLQTRALPDAIVGTTYTTVVTATGGSPPYTYSTTGLPSPAASRP